MSEVSQLWQQGDVLFFKVDRLPTSARDVPRSVRGAVVAEGELTGHAHVVEQENARLYTLNEVLYLVVPEEASCVHEEHDTVLLPPGTYQIGGVREVDYNALEDQERRERFKVDVRSAPPRSKRPRRRSTTERFVEEAKRSAQRQRALEREQETRVTWRYVAD